MHKIIASAIVILIAGAAATTEAARSRTQVEAKIFESKGPIENLEPEVLDFRYSPARWQTCIGLPDDLHKTIVDSDGRLCYEYNGGGVFEYGSWLQAGMEIDGQASESHQQLWSSRIPIVVTEHKTGDLTLRQDAWAAAPTSKEPEKWIPMRADYLWLRIKNTSEGKSSGRIVLKVHSKIPLVLQDNSRLVTKDKPSDVFCTFSPSVESAQAINTPKGYELAVQFAQKELAPGREFGALITICRGREVSAKTDEKDAATEQGRAVKFWQNVNLPYDRFAVPDEKVQALLDSCIRNIYQARERKYGLLRFQVGPTCYRGTWAADGPFILEGVTYLGGWKEARIGLENQVDKDDGPRGVQFSKKSGLRLWMIRRHWELTGDTKWLEGIWPKVEREVNQIVQYRRMTADDPNQPNYRLMPPGHGDGGLGDIHREYTNVYWTLAGLKAAADMADAVNKPCADAWRAEYDDYWQAFDKARNRDKTTDHAGNIYVPVVMQGENKQLPQRGAWSFMHSIYPGMIYDANDKLMLGTLAMLDANQSEGLIYGTGWIEDGIWNYAGSFYAHSHLWLGHGKKAAATLYAFGNHSCPMLCWREEQNCRDKKENYVGDMPHNWASAEFIRLIRHLMILERDKELSLLEGLPYSWTGAGKRTYLKDVPTTFGEVSISVSVADNGRSADIDVSPPRRMPPENIVIHLEQFGRPIKEIKCNGKELKGGICEVSAGQRFVLKVEFAT